MTREEHLVFCKKCLNRKFDPKQGVICKITNQRADFDNECKDYDHDDSVKEIAQPEDKTNTEIITELSDDIIEKLRPHQNMEYAAIGGFLLALICALIWAAITVTTEYQIGYMALAVGLVVGLGVRFFGAGIDQVYGFLGAFLALLSCLLGNLFSQVGFIAQAQSLGYLDTFRLLDMSTILLIYTESFGPMDLVFYGFAIFEGYKFAFRPIQPELIQQEDFTPKNAKLRLPLVIASVVIITITGFVLNQGIEGLQTFYHENGEIMSTGEYVDGKEQGEWKYYDEQGALQVIANYNDGIESGQWKWYYENGEIMRIGNYKQGLNDGVWINYYENGVISDSSVYCNGRLQGPTILKYENGVVFQKGEYKRDRQDGKWLLYYDNAQLNSEGNYISGVLNGIWNYWLYDGGKSMEAEYENAEHFKILNTWDEKGVPKVVNGEGIHEMFYEDGTLMETGRISNGYRIGIWKSYHPNGQLKSEGEHKKEQYFMKNSFDINGTSMVVDGKGEFIEYYPNNINIYEKGMIEGGLREGQWLTYYENSSIAMIDCNYKHGVINGLYTTYFEDGTMMTEGNIKDDKKEGEWSWYYGSGQLQCKANYKSDKKIGRQIFWSEAGRESKEEIYENGELISEKML